MNIELYYREAGSGEPLIMLHGNGESGEYFINQIEHFQSRYRVIAPDTRGHGRSPRGEAPFTIAQFANDLYDFMQGLGIARAMILGFSDGAISHRDRIQDRMPLCRKIAERKEKRRNARPDGERSEHLAFGACKAHDADAGGLRNKGHDQRVPHEDDRGKRPKRPFGDSSRRSFRRQQAPGGIQSGRRRFSGKRWIHMNDTPGGTFAVTPGVSFLYFVC